MEPRLIDLVLLWLRERSGFESSSSLSTTSGGMYCASMSGLYFSLPVAVSVFMCTHVVINDQAVIQDII